MIDHVPSITSTTQAILESPPADDTVKVVNAQFHQHNVAQTGDPHYAAIGVSLRDAENQVMGGLLGCYYYGWLHIEILWVDAALRNQGKGRQLIEMAESAAVEHGCHGAYVETASEDARRFYEREGYDVFGLLDDYPVGHQKFFLKKKLKED
ncbi:MAG: GNAT family N-acetyltransferase [Chloroflexota bacterium]